MSSARPTTIDACRLTHVLWVWGRCALASLALLLTGCQGSSGSQRALDSTLQRHVKYASEAYAEGHVERAIVEYRKAVRRAWAMDDPRESGTAAYNLAACLTSDSRPEEARDWLLDARFEFHRAGTSAGNAWLLEAKIAQSESRFEDVSYLIQRAACTQPPCPDPDTKARCGDSDPCRDSCVAKIPCLGPKLSQQRAGKDCEAAYQAQIHLMRSRLAAEQYDVLVAKRELACACELVVDICSDDLRAELHNVSALIHIAKGEYLQAGAHLDREADNLRSAGNYREIPTALELAAAAYEQSGRNDLAAERLTRVARILCGRGDVDRAWTYVQLALPTAELAGCETTKVRLSLLANEILLILADEGKQPPAIQPQQELGMLAPANEVPNRAE